MGIRIWPSIDDPEKLRKFPADLAMVLLLVPLGLLLFFIFSNFDEIRAFVAWRPVPATVTESRVVMDFGKRFATHPRIAYTYAVDGKEYAGTWDSDFGEKGTKNSLRSFGPDIVKSHPAGSGVTVRVDPKKPANSRLVGLELARQAYLLAFILFLLVVPVVFVFQTIKKKRRLEKLGG